MIEFLIVVFLAAAADRLREISRIDIWKNNSFIMKLGTFWKRWWDSKDANEIRCWKITIGTRVIKIPLHPIFWDGYHSMKSICAGLLTLVIGWYYIGFLAGFLGACIWYVGQQLTLYLVVKEKDGTKLGL